MATGLTQLGQALAGGARDYANIQLSRQAEERENQRRVDALAEQRGYADSVDARERARQLEDEERRRGQRVEDVTLDVLIKEGWLNPAQANDAAAVRAAATARQERFSQEQSRSAALPGRLQVEADLLAERDAELARAERELSAKLSEPEPGPPNAQEVMNLALRMTGKPNPSQQEIAANMEAAAEQIQNQRLQRWFQEQQEAKVQIPLLRSQRADITRNLTFMFQQGITPNRSPSAVLSEPALPSTPPRSGNPMASFAQELDGLLQQRQIDTARPAEISPVQAALPMAQGQDRQLLEQELGRQSAADWTQTKAEPFNAAADKREGILRRLQMVRSGQPVSSTYATLAGPVMAPQPTEQQKARELASLLIELQQADKEEQDARRSMFGISEGAPLAPARNPASVLTIP